MSNRTFIKLDFDGDLPNDLDFTVARTLAVLAIRLDYIRIDRTRRGWHVTVVVHRRISNISVVAIQAILGSDPARETYNLMRARNSRGHSTFWRQRMNVFYSRHYKGSEIYND